MGMGAASCPSLRLCANNSRTWLEQPRFTLREVQCHPVGGSLHTVKSLKAEPMSG